MTLFQFLLGTIRSKIESPGSYTIAEFQFLLGTIRRKNIHAEKAKEKNFNSS